MAAEFYRRGDCGAASGICEAGFDGCTGAAIDSCADCGRMMCEACGTADQERCRECWEKGAHRRCMLRLGHGGSHMFINTRSTFLLPGECTAKEEAA